nr:preprotein translocase SecG subunit [Cryptomonas sp. NIES-3952]
MLHTIWIISSVILIFFIILHNPKSQGLSGQNQMFGATRTAEENVTKITWVFTLVFFVLTIFISSSNI